MVFLWVLYVAFAVIFLGLGALLAGIWIKHIMDWGFDWYTIPVSAIVIAGLVVIAILSGAPIFII